ncbi:MAG: DUF2318 domain-containing protein [Chloroflexi bacterium]|nr:DUF2318 domain-containing protein [Chloroflexota bacterium]
MEALVITLREGIEAALVLGIIIAYLRKSGRMALSGWVYVGLGLAIAASIMVAAVFQLVGFDPENEYLEGVLLGVAGVFVAGMVVWMWRAAKGIKGEMEKRLQDLTAKPAGQVRAQGAPRRGAGGGIGLLLFTFFMVFREGIETVIFLWATALGEEASVLSLLGGAIGLGLAVLFAVLFIRGSLRINLSRFFNVTGIVLLVFAAKLLGGSVHEFAEVGVIPLTKEIMSGLGYFVRDSSSTAIVMALVAVPIFLLLWESFQHKPKLEVADGQGAADRRKRLAAVKLERTWQAGLAVATLLILFALGSVAFAGGNLVDPEPESVAAVGGQIRIPVARLDDGVLHKFVYDDGGVSIRFIMAKLKDGSVASAIDACQICGAAGYGHADGVAICKNCNAPIAMDSIGLGGGCNPLPLEAKAQGTDIVVAVSSLEAAKTKFATR